MAKPNPAQTTTPQEPASNHDNHANPPTSAQPHAKASASQSQASRDEANQPAAQPALGEKEDRHRAPPMQSHPTPSHGASTAPATHASTAQQSPPSGAGTRAHSQHQYHSESPNKPNARPQSYVQRAVSEMADGKPTSPPESSGRSHANAGGQDTHSLHSYESPSPNGDSLTRDVCLALS